MSMLLPSRMDAAAATDPRVGGHLPPPPPLLPASPARLDDKAAGAGLTINMQRVVDADARCGRRASALSLPSLLSAQATISPPNTRRYPPVLAPLRVLPDYCRFPGCANFGKMQGFCHDHIHGRPAASSLAAPPAPAAPVAAPSVPSPMLPGLRSVVPAADAGLGPFHAPAFPPPALKRPPPVAIPVLALPVLDAGDLSKRPRVEDERDGASAAAGFSQPARRAEPRAAKCRREHCENDARRKGLCMEHGGRHFCKMAGCTKCAHRGGFCISHGGGRRCAVANCAKSAQSGGICYSHGGGKRCATDGCSHAARSGGFCIKHGKQQQQQQQRLRADLL